MFLSLRLRVEDERQLFRSAYRLVMVYMYVYIYGYMYMYTIHICYVVCVHEGLVASLTQSVSGRFK